MNQKVKINKNKSHPINSFPLIEIFSPIQVFQNGVRLLTGSEQLQQLPIDFGSPVVQASSADPYIVIVTQVSLSSGLKSKRLEKTLLLQLFFKLP